MKVKNCTTRQSYSKGDYRQRASPADIRLVFYPKESAKRYRSANVLIVLSGRPTKPSIDGDDPNKSVNHLVVDCAT